MKLGFLNPLYARQGPYACAYLDTSRDLDDPDRAVERRRSRLRADLASQGADPATVGAVFRMVEGDRDPSGGQGRAVFAAHGRLALTAALPRPPRRDSARFAMLPDAMPLALQRAPDVPYLAAAVRHTDPDGRRMEVTWQAGRWPAGRVAEGNRRRQRVPADELGQAATAVARHLTELSDRTGAEIIVLSGDRWARDTITRELPPRLRGRTARIHRDNGWSPRNERALLEDELDYLLGGRLAEADRALVSRFRAARARRDGAAEGLAATVAALRDGHVAAVLVDELFDPHLPLHVGLTPRQLALTRCELAAHGVASGWPEETGAALVRAMVCGGAELVVVPRVELPLADGVGVLLRTPEGGPS
ncbi:baeRF2 domain-containing protein [Kitasatospora cineracea]|uniref:baeRF2 domain-containing protein n=1 Tax=Kitasatospora cineracea TaxID=88074 RepID=UPI0037955FFD